MAYRGLNPFGDNSLALSFPFEQNTDDEQGLSAWIGDPSYYSYALGIDIATDYCLESITSTTTPTYRFDAVTLPYTDDSSWSVSFAIRLEEVDNFIYFDFNLGNEVVIEIYGGAVTLFSSTGFTDYFGDFYVGNYTLTYDGINLKLYFEQDLIITRPATPTQAPVVGSILELNWYKCKFYMDELLFWSRTLTDDEAFIVNDNFNLPSVLLLITANQPQIITNRTKVDVSSPLISVNVNDPFISTQYNIIVDGATEPTVRVSSPLLRVFVGYVDNIKNAYIKVDSPIINIVGLNINLWERVFPSSPLIPVTVTSSVAQPYKDKRVKSIGTVTFDKALYWSQNEKVVNFISTNDQTIDGSTVTSVTLLKKFNQPHSIETQIDMSVNKTIIQALILEVNEDSYDIIFTDGSFLTVKNDLLDKPLTFEPIFDGSDEYYMRMGVLV